MSPSRANWWVRDDFASEERGPAAAALPCNQILGSDLIAFRGACLTGFAAGFALGNFREFFAFFLAVPADHSDDLG